MYYEIRVEWDAEAGVWYVEDSNVPGLVGEAATLEAMMALLQVRVLEMLEESGCPRDDDYLLAAAHDGASCANASGGLMGQNFTPGEKTRYQVGTFPTGRGIRLVRNLWLVPLVSDGLNVGREESRDQRPG